MQIQNLHVDVEDRLTSRQQFTNLVTKEGLRSVYRGLTPELLKVIPMVGTMFMVYEWSKDVLDVKHNR
jgi:solute carrier family 25 phosphate transporter 23/24/25/41